MKPLRRLMTWEKHAPSRLTLSATGPGTFPKANKALLRNGLENPFSVCRFVASLHCVTQRDRLVVYIYNSQRANQRHRPRLRKSTNRNQGLITTLFPECPTGGKLEGWTTVSYVQVEDKLDVNLWIGGGVWDNLLISFKRVKSASF